MVGRGWGGVLLSAQCETEFFIAININVDGHIAAQLTVLHRFQ